MPYNLSGIESLNEGIESEQMPSIKSGVALLKGDLGQLIPVMGIYLARVGEIAAGIALSGNWSERSWKNAFVGSSAVQTFVFTFAILGGLNDKIKLPSELSAINFIEGKEGATKELILHWLGRSGLISTGMYIAGERKNVFKQGLAGGAMIELAVLLWAIENKRKKDV